MKKMMILTALLIMTAVASAAKNHFPSWNECTALSVLKQYVADVTDPMSANYIAAEDRIVTFDMDGTFVAELYPTYFEYNMLEYRVFDDPSYMDKAPDDVRKAAQNIRDFVRKGTPLPDHFDLIHAHAAAKAYAGMTLSEFDAYVKEFAARPANGFTGMTYAQSFYRPMLEVMDYLSDNGFTCYVISGSDRYLCRALVQPLGIEPAKVIGMDVCFQASRQGGAAGVDYTMEKGDCLIRTDSLIRKNLKTNKVLQINQEIGKIPVLSFGNSSGDCAMHNYCMSNSRYPSVAFMLVADDDQRDHADLAEGARREALWRQSGYTIISMKNDFRTIYGPGVEKNDFIFEDE